MPLIMITGYPSSGKSTRANQLKAMFEAKLSSPDYKGISYSVELVSDDSLGISKNSYDAGIEEKKIRGSIISAVERHTSKNSILILDSLNYIKGLRYQLYCVARSLGTTHCVIHAASPIEYSRQINLKRGDSGYSQKIFDDLVSRYEEPNSSSRWDSPLFTVLQHMPDEELPFSEIWEAVIEKKAPPPNLATAIEPATESNYLYHLDKSTKELIQLISENQNRNIDVVTIPGTDTKIVLPGRPVSLIELRRLRKQFISINRMHTINFESVPKLFAEYLNANF
ncbi:hypothetical protein BB559_000436 [Furculomyces boomerangus]|uniref:Chromatin associated protein KTI12 n=3 Tax=Harpellales TaxID=61421 RepID=A0A2T9Z572_9FUNG|nr:hypothetical protein BB559_000436 [Furculomyces boomerangus]PVZ98343.1 hypothetical protein BB558_005653 [Smittium angustum]PWA02645.1 hypothetical protein BB558_001221 [Smittium angustum]